MSIFKSKEEKLNDKIAKKAERQELEEKNKHYNEVWEKVQFIPVNNLEEYERVQEYEKGTTEVIKGIRQRTYAHLDMGYDGSKFILLKTESYKQKLIDKNIEALINPVPVAGKINEYICLPVRRKKVKKNEHNI